MRDKENSTSFIRKVDVTHPSNIRIIIPPKIFALLGFPEYLEFSMANGYAKLVNKKNK